MSLKISFVLVALVFSSCDRNANNQSRSGSANVVETHNSRQIKNDDMSDYQCFWFLPIKPKLRFLNIGLRSHTNKTEGAVNQAIIDLLQTGENFARENLIENKNPFGCFFLESGSNALGLSLIPAFEVDERSIPFGHVGDWSNDSSWQIYRSNNLFYTSNSREAGKKITVKSINSLSSINSLEFIDFGTAGFDEGIWESLISTSPKIGLKGLVIHRAGEMLKYRKETVVPDIKGLVIHVDTIQEVEEFGKAFPNVKLLILCISRGDIIGKLMRGKILANNFKYVECLKILPSILPGAGNIPDPNQLSIDICNEALPKSLLKVYLDGTLISRDNMVRYDRFGLLNRDKKDLDVIFMSYGFSTGGARSIDKLEYSEAEKFWRD